VQPPAGEPALRPPLVVDDREQVRFGPELAELDEHALGATNVEQEIVDQGDSRGGVLSVL
jgi:hypothetical protein